MLTTQTIRGFRGIDNVMDHNYIRRRWLASAVGVDINSTGAVVSARGNDLVNPGEAHSLFACPLGLLGVVGTDLVLMDQVGAVLGVIYYSVGHTRVDYVALPDGKVGFSNGYISGVTDGGPATEWGVSRPARPGDAPHSADGLLAAITYVRDADGLESGPTYYPGLVRLDETHENLPQRPGHSINVYYAPFEASLMLAGNTNADTFAFTGGKSDLVRPCQTVNADTPPAWSRMAMWGGRVVGAVENRLVFTRPYQFEHVDLRTDFIQLENTITGIYGHPNGLWVGTEAALIHLVGDRMDTLKLVTAQPGRVIPGSMVACGFAGMDEKVRPDGDGMMCIVDGWITACGDNGKVEALTKGVYKIDAVEVSATMRDRDGVAQYHAASA